MCIRDSPTCSLVRDGEVLSWVKTTKNYVDTLRYDFTTWKQHWIRSQYYLIYPMKLIRSTQFNYIFSLFVISPRLVSSYRYLSLHTHTVCVCVIFMSVGYSFLLLQFRYWRVVIFFLIILQVSDVFVFIINPLDLRASVLLSLAFKFLSDTTSEEFS